MGFEVGQLVVCRARIEDVLGETAVGFHLDDDGLAVGHVYVVREVAARPVAVSELFETSPVWVIRLEGVRVLCVWETGSVADGWHITRLKGVNLFEPVTEEKLALFRQHLEPEPGHVLREDAMETRDK